MKSSRTESAYSPTVFPALAAWATALILLGAPAEVSFICAAVAALATATLYATPPWRGTAVSIAACTAAAAATVAFHTHAVSTGPIPDLARKGITATAEVVLTNDPRTRRNPRFPGESVVAEARLELLQTPTTHLTLSTPVTLFATGPHWRTLLPSQRLKITAKLAPADPSDLTAALLLVKGTPQPLGTPSWIQTAAGALRSGLRAAADPFPEDQRGLLPALVVGDTSRMDPQVTADFKEAGLTHLTAVSGANLAIIAGAALALSRLTGLPLPVRAILAATAMIAFAVVARPSPSVLRALAMGLAAALALATGRPRHGMAALSISVLFLILFSPDLARSYGFALSVTATAGILLLAPKWRDHLSQPQPTPPNPHPQTRPKPTPANLQLTLTPSEPRTTTEPLTTGPLTTGLPATQPPTTGPAATEPVTTAQPPTTRPAATEPITTAQPLTARPAASLALITEAPQTRSTRKRHHPRPRSSVAQAATSLLRPRRALPRWLAEAIAVPAAAQFAVTPVLVLMSGQVTPVAVIANLLAGPAVAPATLLGFAASVVAPISVEAARILLIPAGYAVGWIITVAQWAAGLPFATIPWPGGLLGLALLAVAVAVAVPLLRHPRCRAVTLAVLAGILIAAMVLPPALSPWPPRRWLMVMCDVGQGDGMAIAAGPGRAVVVDTGPDPTPMDRCLRDLGIREIPLIILTHPHADHIGGLTGALKNRRIGAALLTNHPATPAPITRTFATHHIPQWTATPGAQWTFGPSELTVLAPPATPPTAHTGTEGSEINNTSVVLRVRWHAGSILLSGDIETEAQSDLLRTTSPAADILKVPHHGSARQDPAFFSAVGARAALISVGSDNTYGHPAPATLALLHRSGTRVYRTDQSGDLAITDHNATLSITPRN
ncbi:ComEC/Rec2 family competence protein [Nonomuraea sp. NPDC059007]|uniref:ComEC/Rec2 family competence protein n=1 Tax=Nonomuraea sp. NPDC059007 TaxID=3346692 RepID=UPI003694DE45